MFSNRPLPLNPVQNPIVDSVWVQQNTNGAGSTPPPSNNFLLLSGSNFLLLSGGNLELL